MLATLDSFACAAYCPKDICIKTISEFQWYLFCKHMAGSDKLPPILGALRQHILRAISKPEYGERAALLCRTLS